MTATPNAQRSPPRTEAERYLWLRLLRSRRVGPPTFYRLMAAHGSARAALEALPAMARAAGVAGYEICPAPVIEAELRTARSFKATMICLGDRHYPPALAQLPDAPPILWAYGDLALTQRSIVAIVGARNASSLGMRMAAALARDLGAAGFCVVSGLARGVDSAAHRAALTSGTIAVFAGGLDVVYPTASAELAQNIYAQGLCLSERPMGHMPQARHFPARNRIVSGLSRAVIVVEAAARSGSLLTAGMALDQGREVLAVPGHPFDRRAMGCNMLIRDGAMLVRGAEDVIEAIGPAQTPPKAEASPEGSGRSDSQGASSETPPAPAQPKRSPASAPSTPASSTLAPAKDPRTVAALGEQILALLGAAPVAEDQLIRDLGLPVQQVMPTLVDLELNGLITRHPGGLLSR